MVKSASCENDVLNLILDLVHTVWKEERVARD